MNKDTKKVTDSRNYRYRSTVIVVRHGERLDYVQRAAGKNWCQANPEQPWNPPLTEKGLDMAQELGAALKDKILPELRLPPIGAIYTSPFLRCRQTAAGITRGMSSVGIDVKDYPDSNRNHAAEFEVKVRVELGLTESMNENWFRSWSLPGTDGTWGYMKEIPINQFKDEMDPRARQPVETLLNWKDSISDTHGILDGRMDQDYQSRTSVGGEYSFAENPPKLESFLIQRDRMAKTMNILAESCKHDRTSSCIAPDEETDNEMTIVLVSHGGPVTHLYESLTGNSWEEHGVAKYCSFSIYRNQEETSNLDDEKDVTEVKKWTSLVINRVLWEDDKDDDSKKESSR